MNERYDFGYMSVDWIKHQFPRVKVRQITTAKHISLVECFGDFDSALPALRQITLTEETHEKKTQTPFESFADMIF